MKATILILLTLGVSGVFADGHTLRYFFSRVSGTGFGFPEYTFGAYLDDKLLHQYSSDTKQVHSIASWMSKEGPEYWKRQLNRAQFHQHSFKYHLNFVMRLFNQTKGFHSAQWMYGCELRDDGTTVAYSQVGYDGRDGIFLDKQRAIYIPTVHQFQIITQDWNSERKWGDQMNFVLENECIPQLKKFINYGREDLEKRVRPEVKVLVRPQSEGLTRLYCLVYGFHPRAVDVKLVRNEVDHVPLEEMGPILPHPDGTYQIRVSAEVQTREGDTYSCHVDHSSLGDKVLIVKWEPDNGSPFGITISVALGCLISVSAIAVAGICLIKKRNVTTGEHKATSDEDPATLISNIQYT